MTEKRGLYGRAAVLAVPDEMLIDLARLFANAGFAPLLAFDAQQVVDFATRCEVVIVDDTVDPDGRMLQRAGSADNTIRVLVTDTHTRVPADVHAVVPPGLPPEEVLARTQALLALRGDRGTDATLEWGPLQLDLRRREARWFGVRCSLTQTQFDILVVLVDAGGAVVSKTELQKAVWPDEPPDAGERLVAHIRRIRSRIEEDPSHPRFLLTSRGIGFCLAALDDEDEFTGAPRSDYLRSVQGHIA